MIDAELKADLTCEDRPVQIINFKGIIRTKYLNISPGMNRIVKCSGHLAEESSLKPRNTLPAFLYVLHHPSTFQQCKYLPEK